MKKKPAPVPVRRKSGPRPGTTSRRAEDRLSARLEIRLTPAESVEVEAAVARLGRSGSSLGREGLLTLIRDKTPSS